MAFCHLLMYIGDTGNIGVECSLCLWVKVAKHITPSLCDIVKVSIYDQ